jgi:hypothetical protein
VDHRQAAIDAVVQAQKDFTPCFDHPDRMREARARHYVAAAAPHLAAAERERIGRQLMREASRLNGMKLTDAAKVLRAMAAAIAPADCEEAAGAP